MKPILMLLSIIFTISKLSAQNTVANESLDEKGFLSVGINPTYPIFGGYGVKIFYNFPKQFSIGLASESVKNLPENTEKQFFNNSKDIKVNWDYSIGLEARYHFKKQNNNIKGLYTFATLGYEQWTIKKDDDKAVVPNSIQEDNLDNWYSSLGLGYNYFPIKDCKLWVGAAYNIIFILNNTQDKTINNATYNIKTIVPPSFIPNLYVGWRF
jgi:hypothetical protein